MAHVSKTAKPDSFMLSAADALSAQGPVAAELPGFRARAAQQEMAAAIEEAIAGRSLFVAESGTGTGKTFAYLVPAILSGKRTLVSTGTKNLQDQLYHRDLPFVLKALRSSASIALLKGRANYLCLHRLKNLEGENLTRRELDWLSRLQAWSRATTFGDIAEVNDIPEDAGIWPQATSTAENCLGSQCDRFDDCFVNRARREAQASDILVVNHHLFFADLSLKEEGFGQLLPGVEAVIFDEAHQLPEIASNFFGTHLSSHQLHALCRDTLMEETKEKSGMPGLKEAIDNLAKATSDFRLSLGAEPRRDAWPSIEKINSVTSALDVLRERLTDLSARLEKASAVGAGLAQCNLRANDLLGRLLTLTQDAPTGYLVWLETQARSFILHLTPLDVSVPFRPHLDDARAWIFTSATLAMEQSFEHFKNQLGLDRAHTAQWLSPFDYQAQALLYLPSNLLEPNDARYTRAVVEAALPVIEASRGRAFFLFTSHRALREAAEWLATRVQFPLLIQGESPRSELLARFRDLGNAVLLGSQSFWEGVDVKGEALSCVIIDKLPFASPGDPVFRARAAALEEQGRNPFREHQLPEAVIALKQGVGRLIRDETDRGVLMLCDPRLLSKSYGKTFLRSLPPMRRSRDLDDVRRFFS